jgi:hypothetical protein
MRFSFDLLQAPETQGSRQLTDSEMLFLISVDLMGLVLIVVSCSKKAVR